MELDYPVIQPTIPWEDDRVQLVYKILAQSGEVGPEDPSEHWEGWQARRIVEALYDSTPAAMWRVRGEPDPHPDLIDRERAQLPMGQLTDEELANAAFMNYDQRPAVEDLILRKAWTPLVWMQALKERVRWMSRQLVKARKRIDELEARIPMPDAVAHKLSVWHLTAHGAWFRVGDEGPGHQLVAWRYMPGDKHAELLFDSPERRPIFMDPVLIPMMVESPRPEGGIFVSVPLPDAGFPIELNDKIKGWVYDREAYLIINQGTRSKPMRLTNYVLSRHHCTLEYERGGGGRGSLTISVAQALKLRVEHREGSEAIDVIYG
jgi:hypothetical protein